VFSPAVPCAASDPNKA